jgi:pyridoxine 5-phosphate synthase
VPNLINVALDCEKFGAQGITIHPRPDERHIRYKDVFDLKKVVSTELNIEGYPNERFIDLVLEVKPEQVTLVPDPPGVLTSNAGWDLLKNANFLNPILERFKNAGIRTSIFMGTEANQLIILSDVITDRVELYTGPYAENFPSSPEGAIEDYVNAADLINKYNKGINAGHDLDLKNLNYFSKKINGLLEVSIGHALISDALYLGLETTVKSYLNELK